MCQRGAVVQWLERVVSVGAVAQWLERVVLVGPGSSVGRARCANGAR